MHLRLALNLWHFLLDLGALYALRLVLNFYEIHNKTIFFTFFRLVLPFQFLHLFFFAVPRHPWEKKTNV
jgi:hypothetical protein